MIFVKSNDGFIFCIFFYNIFESREKNRQIFIFASSFSGLTCPCCKIFSKKYSCCIYFCTSRMREKGGETMKYFVRHFLYDAGSVVRVTSQGFSSCLQCLWALAELLLPTDIVRSAYLLVGQEFSFLFRENGLRYIIL